MSHSSSVSCLTCEARNKRCDGTRGPSGCRRCAQARIKCEGYPTDSSSLPRLKRNTRENQQSSLTHDANLESISPDETPQSMTSSSSPLAQNEVPQLVEDGSTVPGARDDYLDLQTGAPNPQHDTSLFLGYPPMTVGQTSISPIGYIPMSAGNFPIPSSLASVNQMLTPPMGVGTSLFRSRQPIVPSQANLSNSVFGFAQSEPAVPLTPESPVSHLSVARGVSPGRDQGSDVQQEPSLSYYPAAGSAPQWPESYLDDDPEPDDPENIEAGLWHGLTLDRQVESNTLPFVVHSSSIWMSLFVFDPTRILPAVANHIRQGYSFGGELRDTMLLICNSSLAISGLTDYDLAYFTTLYKLLVDRVVAIQARPDVEVTREVAYGMMEHSHQFISTLFKVGSLVDVLNVMTLYAPIFRRACPEPTEGLVNLPQRLIATEVQLKYYAGMDVLQSLITHRPMFFRYDLDFSSPRQEEFVRLGMGPGLVWLYGVPDWLMVILARMNTLLEEFGNQVDLVRVQELEQDIAACAPVINPGNDVDPILSIGRIMVQESWRMAAQVYLYMGLCGADSTDARVAKVQKGFMRLLKGIKPRRNPDSFLILPVLVIGVSAISHADRSTHLSRLWGVSECTKPGTVGNDIIRILNDIWACTTKRPATWSDLRVAYSRVTGMTFEFEL